MGDKANEVLWIVKDGNEYIAFDAPKDCVPKKPEETKIMFTSTSDIVKAGSHPWKLVKKNNEQGWFDTTYL